MTSPTALERLLAFLPDTPDCAYLLLEKVEYAREVEQEARDHGLFPLVSHALPQAFPLRREERLAAQFRSVQHCRQTADLFGQLEAAGIHVLVLKGAALANLLYPQPWLRPSGDIDLLIRLADHPHAVALLESQGWQMTIGPRESRLQFGHDVSLVKQRSLLELHHKPSWHFQSAFDIEALLRRKQTVMVEGRPVATLGEVDMLVYLCVHAGAHIFEGVKWLYDLKLAALKMRDWQQVVATARAARVAAVVGAALLEAQRRVEAPVPDEVIKQLYPGRLRYLTARATRKLPPDYWRTRSFVYDLLLADRLSVEWALRLVAPPVNRVRRAMQCLIGTKNA